MEKEQIKKIYSLLINNYYEYYCTVYYEFIMEAIANTLKDFKNKKTYDIDDIHKNIKENYI